MRRKEFSMNEQAEVEQFLNEMTYGCLGTTGEDGWPHVTPVNYVYHQGKIYFHGSRNGQKMKHLKACKQVTFLIAKEHSLIPSYYTDPEMACPATAYFKSVLIKGTAELVEDPVEKAGALQAFMSKLQPEGGYRPITAEDPEYRPRIKGVAVLAIKIMEMSAKFKFGQNLQEEVRESIITSLNSRKRELDEETARLMRKYCPAHKDSGNDPTEA
ncbi:pyridoxamine 5'-phosphate oxidase family protein [Paenibacillus sp. 32O-W]|uniref:pyridoxamine 5'-phosphate oxidase family protein n=1 Tax=Paenibacillus sp. 32O-W TaxID=1695218 RepID=UPI0011A2C2A2|nr:pyridoxamine 5'-phosphate oxidase family protein [Paenibacillus sp. 32O-W]